MFQLSSIGNQFYFAGLTKGMTFFARVFTFANLRSASSLVSSGVVIIGLCCSVLQCVAVWCSVVQCGAVCCSVLQCVEVHCSV